MDMNIYRNTEVKPPVHETPTVYQIEKQLKEIGIGKESNVVCYDAADGIFACRVAVLLRAFGVSHTQVLNVKFSNHIKAPETKKELLKPLKAHGKDFGFTLPSSIFASETEVSLICGGQATGTQIIEVKPAEAFKKESFPLAKHVAEIDVFSSMHKAVESDVVMKLMKDRGIKADKPIILVGGSPKSFVVKAAMDHLGFSSVRICELSLAKYKTIQEAKDKATKEGIASGTEWFSNTKPETAQKPEDSKAPVQQTQ